MCSPYMLHWIYGMEWKTIKNLQELRSSIWNSSFSLRSIQQNICVPLTQHPPPLVKKKKRKGKIFKKEQKVYQSKVPNIVEIPKQCHFKGKQRQPTTGRILENFNKKILKMSIKPRSLSSLPIRYIFIFKLSQT